VNASRLTPVGDVIDPVSKWLALERLCQLNESVSEGSAEFSRLFDMLRSVGVSSDEIFEALDA